MEALEFVGFSGFTRLLASLFVWLVSAIILHQVSGWEAILGNLAETFCFLASGILLFFIVLLWKFIEIPPKFHKEQEIKISNLETVILKWAVTEAQYEGLLALRQKGCDAVLDESIPEAQRWKIFKDWLIEVRAYLKVNFSNVHAERFYTSVMVENRSGNALKNQFFAKEEFLRSVIDPYLQRANQMHESRISA